VTWDVNGWNGDYTLDYNFEAAYYGVFGSNHPELAAPYFKALVDGVPAARRGATAVAARRGAVAAGREHNSRQHNSRQHNTQAAASADNISTCMAKHPNATHFNAHISAWGYGDFDEEWEYKVGQHMMRGSMMSINRVGVRGGAAHDVEYYTHYTLYYYTRWGST
jgi:hypothetical protein